MIAVAFSGVMCAHRVAADIGKLGAIFISKAPFVSRKIFSTSSDFWSIQENLVNEKYLIFFQSKEKFKENGKRFSF